MTRFVGIVLLSTFAGTSVSAQIVSATLDILDGSDPGAPTPPGIIVLDGFVDVATTDTWTAAGIVCRTNNDVLLRYADGDANTAGVQPRLVNPGADNDRFVTMVSRPRLRNSNARFNNGAAAVAGWYDPGGPPGPGGQKPDLLNVAYFASPPGDYPSVDGYVLRLAFSAPGQDASTVLLTQTETPPDAAHPLLLASIFSEGADFGWSNATFDVLGLSGGNWYLWGIPEPGTMASVLLGAAMAMRFGQGRAR